MSVLHARSPTKTPMMATHPTNTANACSATEAHISRKEPAIQAGTESTRTRHIFADPLKPLRLQVRLETPIKSLIANTRVRVEFDGSIICTPSTNNNGEIEVLFIPQTLGAKKLAVFIEDKTSPIFEEILLLERFQT